MWTLGTGPPPAAWRGSCALPWLLAPPEHRRAESHRGWHIAVGGTWHRRGTCRDRSLSPPRCRSCRAWGVGHGPTRPHRRGPGAALPPRTRPGRPRAGRWSRRRRVRSGPAAQKSFGWGQRPHPSSCPHPLAAAPTPHTTRVGSHTPQLSQRGFGLVSAHRHSWQRPAPPRAPTSPKPPQPCWLPPTPDSPAAPHLLTAPAPPQGPHSQNGPKPRSQPPLPQSAPHPPPPPPVPARTPSFPRTPPSAP